MADISPESETPTPYATICRGDAGAGHKGCGKVYMTREAYMAQMMAPDSLWLCAQCGYPATWDDDNYEEHFPAEALRKEAE
jgi:hypothetical protein